MTREEPPEIAKLRRRLERERIARQEAEAIAERGLRDLYQRKKQLKLLEKVATIANSSRSVRDVLQSTLTEICGFMDWPVGHALLLDQDSAEPALRSAAIWHAADPDRIAGFQRATEDSAFPSGVGLPGEVMASAKPHWFFNAPEEGNFPRRRPALACGIKAGFAFPVLVGEDVAAVLEFFAYSTIEQDEALLGLMSQIGVQLGRVIERRRAEERLIHDASHDALTDLPNRSLFLDRLGLAIARRKLNRGVHFAVLFIDLDRFKVVNDSLGHLAGDRMIVEVAERLTAALHQEELSAMSGTDGLLARIGGDEFAILLTDIGDPSDAVRFSHRVQESLRRPFTIDGQEIHTSASIGISLSTTPYAYAEDVLRDADLAMYRAKTLGKSRTEMFHREMHRSAMTRLTLEADLRRAMVNGEFLLHYQPIVSLESLEVVGFEALVRWRRPDGSMVYPGDFIGIVEDTGLIVALGFWILREACMATRRWQREFPRETPLTISVNISPRQFAEPDLVAQVRRIIAETGIDPQTVRLEITESVTIGDADREVSMLSQLKDLGIRLSIDDFGTGYSSLSYLHRLPLDVLKIDRSFVSAMDKSAESFQIVNTIMNLARNLGMHVVAEGAEVAGQIEQLQSLGCDYGQGYFFSKPMDPADVVKLLKGPTHWAGV
ncbi:diguanylate cyclase (GGDEF)-like protein [Skermanella aerolata]|nr:GGDEF domain-containing protein [Skermanella aerolata]KJB96342.1 diguanylate cyclase [Skermanella aerolata KACC 11604]